MEKPICSEKGSYDYNEIIHYIEWKYDIEVRNYYRYELFKVFREEKQLPRLIHPYIFLKTIAEKMDHIQERDQYNASFLKQKEAFETWKKENNRYDPVYRDFWHWILKEYDIENRETITFTLQSHLEDEDTPEWVLTILRLIQAEFPEKTLSIYNEW